MAELMWQGLPKRPVGCGGCTACCTVTAVAQLRKPMYCACPHAAAGGCSAYATRPAECANYECGYLMGLFGGNERYRPDRCGFIINLTFRGQELWLESYQVRPQTGSDEMHIVRLLQTLAKGGRKVHGVMHFPYEALVPMPFTPDERYGIDLSAASDKARTADGFHYHFDGPTRFFS